MRIDQGKLAKNKGSIRPRDARRQDPEPPKALRKAVKKPRSLKPFGIRYESNDLVIRDGKIAEAWRWHEFWYETHEQRDQALRTFQRRYRNDRFYRNHRAIERAAQLRQRGAQ